MNIKEYQIFVKLPNIIECGIWIVYNLVTMCIQQITYFIISNTRVILISIIAIIAFVFYFLSTIKKRESFFLYGLAILCVGLFVLINWWPIYAEQFSAWSTVIIAIFTVITIGENRRLRKDAIDRENRENKRQQVKEVINWSKGILKVGTSGSLETYDAIYNNMRSIYHSDKTELKKDVEFQMETRIWFGILDELQNLIVESAYIMGIVKNFEQEKELADSVLVTFIKLKQHNKIINLAIQDKIKKKECIGRHRKKLDTDAKKLIEKSVQVLSKL